MQKKLMLMTLAALAAILAGCARRPLPAYVWPLPPAPARFVWDGSFATESDVVDNPLLEFLVGSDYDKSLKRPTAVAVHGGVALVADQAAAFRFDFVHRRLERFGGDGLSGQIKTPVGVALDDAGNGYLVDAGSRMVYIADADNRPSGGFVLPDGLVQPGRPGISGSRFFLPDVRGHKIVVLSLDGRRLGEFGSEGSGDGQFRRPTSVAVAGDGVIAVSDSFNSRVQLFAPDLTHMATLGGKPGLFRLPVSVTFDQSGRLYVADSVRRGVVICERSGELLMVLGAPYLPGQDEERSPGAVAMPAGVAFAGGSLYVVDQLGKTLQRFRSTTP